MEMQSRPNVPALADRSKETTRYNLLKFYALCRRKYIMCKPTPLCKLCKFQSEPLDQHPRGAARGVGGVICKSVITQSRADG